MRASRPLGPVRCGRSQSARRIDRKGEAWSGRSPELRNRLEPWSFLPLRKGSLFQINTRKTKPKPGTFKKTENAQSEATRFLWRLDARRPRRAAVCWRLFFLPLGKELEAYGRSRLRSEKRDRCREGTVPSRAGRGSAEGRRHPSGGSEQRAQMPARRPTMTSPSRSPQAGFLPSELALSSPGPLSPSGTKGGSQYYSYAGHPRRRAAESGLGEWGPRHPPPPSGWRGLAGGTGL